MLEHHLLTVRANGQAEMAYTGNTPWHKLGQAVTKGASVDIWRRQAGLDWDAKASKMMYYPIEGRSTLKQYEHKKVLYRSDTGAPLGAVSSDYKVVQPSEVLEFFRDLTESGGWHIHTAGSMRGGSKIWAMASSNIEGAVKKVDKVKGNLLLATSLDGSMKTTALLTSVRVVCANTLRIALAGNDKVTMSHRSHFNPDQMKESLGVAVSAFEAFMLDARKLSDKIISTAEATDVLRRIFGQPTAKELSETSSQFEFDALMAQFSSDKGKKMKEQRSVAQTLDLFQGAGIGSELPGSVGTAWGLLNAITQHIDHTRGRTDDTRMESAWFGLGNEQKTKAFDILTEAI